MASRRSTEERHCIDAAMNIFAAAACKKWPRKTVLSAGHQRHINPESGFWETRTTESCLLTITRRLGACEARQLPTPLFVWWMELSFHNNSALTHIFVGSLGFEYRSCNCMVLVKQCGTLRMHFTSNIALAMLIYRPHFWDLNEYDLFFFLLWVFSALNWWNFDPKYDRDTGLIPLRAMSHSAVECWAARLRHFTTLPLFSPVRRTRFDSFLELKLCCVTLSSALCHVGSSNCVGKLHNITSHRHCFIPSVQPQRRMNCIRHGDLFVCTQSNTQQLVNVNNIVRLHMSFIAVCKHTPQRPDINITALFFKPRSSFSCHRCFSDPIIHTSFTFSERFISSFCSIWRPSQLKSARVDHHSLDSRASQGSWQSNF